MVYTSSIDQFCCVIILGMFTTAVEIQSFRVWFKLLLAGDAKVSGSQINAWISNSQVP